MIQLIYFFSNKVTSLRFLCGGSAIPILLLVGAAAIPGGVPCTAAEPFHGSQGKIRAPGVRLLATTRAQPEQFMDRYLYPPTLELRPVDDAREYFVRVVDSEGARFELSSEETLIPLDPIWDQMASGLVRMRVVAQLEGDDRPEFSEGPGGILVLFKATGFDPERVDPPRMPLEDAVDRIYEFLTTFEHPDNHDPDLPPFIWHSTTNAKGVRLSKATFPALHYPHYLRFFMEYARMRPERADEAHRMAALIAEKVRDFVTPADFDWPGMPYTTIERGVMGGFREQGNMIQPLKGALLGSVLFDYGQEMEDQASIDFALHMGTVLAERQRPSGGFPVRIDAEASASEEGGESSNVIFAVELWDRLETIRPGKFIAARDKALNWLFEHPVKDHKWMATFEDILLGNEKNYNHHDATHMALYLLKNREKDDSYLPLAREIERWIEEAFVLYAEEYPITHLRFPTPAVTEQVTHYWPIDAHMARNIGLQVGMYQATGEEIFLQKAQAMANTLTHYLTDDGVPLTYAPDPDLGYGRQDVVWFGCAASTGFGLMEVLRELDSSEPLSAR